MNTTRGSLLLRLRDPGNSQAWGEFMSIYQPLLTRYSRSRGLGAADAEDVAQHCLTVITQKIQDFEYDPRYGRFRAWLRKMVDNRIVDLLRRRHERCADSSDFRRPQQRERSPDEVWGQIWLEEHLRHCMRVVKAQVAPKTFEAFFRTAINEQPVETVCAELGMTANQLYVARSRVTRRLQDIMRELIDDK